jgi:hypothetical protein
MIFFEQHTKTSISRLNDLLIKFQERIKGADFNAVLLLKRTCYQFNYLSTQFIYSTTILDWRSVCFVRCLPWVNSLLRSLCL